MHAIVKFFTPKDPPPDRDGTWRAAGASLLVLIVVVSLLVLQRLDAALSSIIDIRSVGGDAVANGSVPGGLGVVWIVATLVGVAALFVLVRWAVAVDPLVRKLAWVVIGIWVVSAVLGFDVLMKETGHSVLSFSGGETTIQSIRGALRTGGLLAALFALLSVKGLGDPRKLWTQASVIRVQLTFLLLLVVLIYAFPMTSAQAIDVLRAWTDAAFVRVVCAIAAAVLLGAVVRDSCASFLKQAQATTDALPDLPALAAVPPQAAAAPTTLPAQWWTRAARWLRNVARAAPRAVMVGLPQLLWRALRALGRIATWKSLVRWIRHRLATRSFFAMLLVAGGVVLTIATHWTLIFAVALALAAWIITQAADPLPFRRDPAEPAAAGDTAMASLRKLARFLACAPLLTLFLGLVVATADSFLIRGASGRDDFRLLGITALVGLGCAVLLLHAGTRVPSTPPWRRPLARWYLLVIAFVTVMGCGWSGALGEICAAAFLVLACYLALAREHDDSSEQEIWAGLGAFLGAAAAVYREPVGGSDAIGTFALVMLAMVGILWVLDRLAHIAARREPHGVFAHVLPKRVPIVTLLGLWVVAAFAWGPDTFHQVRGIDWPPASVTPSALAAVSAARGDPRTFDEAVDAWLDVQAGGENTLDDVNMVLVGAAGGGEKVAFWTDLVLDCAFSNAGKDREGHCDGRSQRAESGRPSTRAWPDRIFLSSSVSGGSVGIYRYLRSLTQVRAGEAWPGDADAAWTTDDSGVPKEVLSPIAGWGLFHDLPIFLAGAPTDPTHCTGIWWCRWHADRAAVQEEAVAEPFSTTDELDWFGGHSAQPVATAPSALDGGGRAPVAVFNAAIDGGNGRVLMAPFRLTRPYDPTDTCLPLTTERSETDYTGPDVPGAIDAHDLIAPNTQIPLVTAALLTARFPVVAPAGRLGKVESTPALSSTDGSHCKSGLPLPDIRVRDGGYMDNSGLLTIVDLLPALRADIAAWKRKHHRLQLHVHIKVVSIDDDAATLRPQPTNFHEESAGPAGLTKRASSDYLTRLARDALTTETRKALAAQSRPPETRPGVDVMYLRISPPPSVGAHAATGWELSSTTRKRHLVAALTGPAESPAGGETAARRTLREFRCMLENGSYDVTINLASPFVCSHQE